MAVVVYRILLIVYLKTKITDVSLKLLGLIEESI